MTSEQLAKRIENTPIGPFAMLLGLTEEHFNDLVAARRKIAESLRFREAIREHWLTGIHCDRDAKTDVATCFCAVWRSEPMPNVISAVEAWIEHVSEVTGS